MFNKTLRISWMIAVALILITHITGCMEVDSEGNPVPVTTTTTLGPATIVTWSNPKNHDKFVRSYDEQTHMVCYERNQLPLGCLPLDYSVTSEEIKSGVYIPDPYSPDYKPVLPEIKDVK